MNIPTSSVLGETTLTTANMDDRTASHTIPQMASNNVVINITGGCEYCNGTNEQKPLFHENNYSPYTRMESCITVSESMDGKRYLIDVDLWDGANACAAFEINYCPMCGRKLGVEG